MKSFKQFFYNHFLNKKETLLKEDCEKPIEQSIFNDKVREAFVDFTSFEPSENIAVIGGLAYSTYTTPRNTQDIDFVVNCDAEIDKIQLRVASKFKRIRPHALMHKKTGVEIEFITSNLVNVANSVVLDTISTAVSHSVNHCDTKVANPKMLIVMKLGRASDTKNPKHYIDKSDILTLILKYPDVTVDDEEIPFKQKELFNQLKKEALEIRK